MFRSFWAEVIVWSVRPKSKVAAEAHAEARVAVAADILE